MCLWCIYSCIYCVILIITDTDPTTVKVNHTMEPDVYSGNYNLTIYISLLTNDPLLVASILSIRVSNHKQVGMFSENFTQEDIYPTENTVKINLSSFVECVNYIIYIM